MAEPTGFVDTRKPREKYLQRWTVLENERSSWLEHWRDLSDYILPRRSRFLSTDRNKGSKKNDKIINSTATKAFRTLQSGMMSGLSSPARQWFRLAVPDPDMMKRGGVLKWLDSVEKRMMQVFAMSNIYNALPQVYGDIGVFGTNCTIIDEDEEDVLRAFVLPVGQYCLANSKRLAVDTIYEKFSMTTSQIVERFGLDRVSSRVRSCWEKSQYDEWHEVLRVVEPNRDRDPTKVDAGGMLYRTAWMEIAAAEQAGQLLWSGGYREWPGLCPRWDATGEDVYGHSPGMDALGDCRALQLLERRKAQTIDKMVTPPLIAPSSLRTAGGRPSQLPGDVTYVDSVGPGMTMAPVFQIAPQAVAYLDASVKDHEKRINQAAYADLWLMLAMDERQQPATAREIAERHEEKLIQLGPVLERLHDELLDPLIERAFFIMLRRGLIPPPPQELMGSTLRVEYVSQMAQAQKMVGINSLERLGATIMGLAKINPDVLDKMDWDKYVESMAQMLATDPNVVRDDREAQAIRQGRAKMQQQQMAVEQAKLSAEATNKLANAPMPEDDDEEPTNMLQQMQQAQGGGNGVQG